MAPHAQPREWMENGWMAAVARTCDVRRFDVAALGVADSAICWPILSRVCCVILRSGTVVVVVVVVERDKHDERRRSGHVVRRGR